MYYPVVQQVQVMFYISKFKACSSVYSRFAESWPFPSMLVQAVILSLTDIFVVLLQVLSPVVNNLWLMRSIGNLTTVAVSIEFPRMKILLPYIIKFYGESFTNSNIVYETASLSAVIYPKPTNTMRTLNYNSYNGSRHKRSVAQSLHIELLSCHESFLDENLDRVEGS